MLIVKLLTIMIMCISITTLTTNTLLVITTGVIPTHLMIRMAHRATATQDQDKIRTSKIIVASTSQKNTLSLLMTSME